MRGILHRPGVQAVFVDTPGLHRPRTALGRRLNDQVGEALGDADAGDSGSEDDDAAGGKRRKRKRSFWRELFIVVVAALNLALAERIAHLSEVRLRRSLGL